MFTEANTVEQMILDTAAKLHSKQTSMVREDAPPYGAHCSAMNCAQRVGQSGQRLRGLCTKNVFCTESPGIYATDMCPSRERAGIVNKKSTCEFHKHSVTLSVRRSVEWLEHVVLLCRMNARHSRARFILSYNPFHLHTENRDGLVHCRKFAGSIPRNLSPCFSPKRDFTKVVRCRLACARFDVPS